jgi:4-hydroxy-tetrahydrodipicolinate synthase
MSAEKYRSIQKQLKRPIYPIPPAFNKDESMDYEGVRSYVSFLKQHGSLPVMVTAGTSRINLLSDEELKKLNEVVTEEAHKGPTRQLAIVSNHVVGSLKNTISFAHHAESIGADILLVFYPERYYDDEAVADYFRQVANRSNVPLMIHAMPMKSAKNGSFKPFDHALCEKLAEIEHVVGIKEESLDETVRYRIARNLNERLAICVAGESMRMFMSSAPFGVQSYLVGIGSMVPRIEEDFFEKYQAGDHAAAAKIVHEIEEPFFSVAKSIGWHVAMKTSMNLLGLMQPYERRPLKEGTEQDRKKLTEVMKSTGMCI